MNIIQEDGPLKPFDISYRENDKQFLKLDQALPINEFIATLQKRNLENEFQFLRLITETKDHEKQLIKNVQLQHLNRYSNILPFGYNVVKPEIQSPNSNKYSTPRDKFYINANYIKSIDNREKMYIATQGPIPESLSDFWHMVWTNNVGLVVMLCNLTDKGRIQCEQYWPAPGKSLKYGPYEVSSISCTEKQKQLYESKILLKLQQEQHEITHYMWTGWPDFGIPQDNFKVLDFLAQTANISAFAQQRPVIHCSAGVGRTGTFLSICYLKQLLQTQDAKLSVFSIARRLREQRAFSINTAEQYQLVYKYAIWLIETLKYI